MDIPFIATIVITVAAGIAASVLVIRPTAGRTAVAKIFARIALLGAAALFALLNG